MYRFKNHQQVDYWIYNSNKKINWNNKTLTVHYNVIMKMNGNAKSWLYTCNEILTLQLFLLWKHYYYLSKIDYSQYFCACTRQF